MKTLEPMLIVGEVIVDYTLPKPGIKCKLRLGGVVHAARGSWAAGIRYAVAAVCPKYLVDQAAEYLIHHGCEEFIWLGEVTGAPNVISIVDVTELSDQGYEDILREVKNVVIFNEGERLSKYKNVIIFPGKFNLNLIRSQFSKEAEFSFDIAYDLSDIDQLSSYSGNIKCVILSTSSEVFNKYGRYSLDDMMSYLSSIKFEVFLLKENRGGSRLFIPSSGVIEQVSAFLSSTVNSVGVGDVYSSVMVGLKSLGWVDAAWRGARSAMYYAQTTYPDDFKLSVSRDFNLTVDEIKGLNGVILPWHDRKKYSVYLAAPDFSYIEKPEIDLAIQSMDYHNFRVRRPILENGELSLKSSQSLLLQTYYKDVDLLKKCDFIFAIPLNRDPGTLVEMGMAISLGKPVVTFDPRKENDNTMVISGSYVYSSDFDICLNGLFRAMSDFRRR